MGEEVQKKALTAATPAKETQVKALAVVELRTQDLARILKAVPQLVRHALEGLKMLTQTDLDRERYESRRKAQLDYNTGLKVARLEGRQEGEKIGMIHLCERMLNRPQTPTEQLAGLSMEELTRLADDLQAHLLKPS